MLLLIVLGKFLVWVTVVRLFRYPALTAIAVGAGLTQIGELSFVVVQVGRSAGILAENVVLHGDRRVIDLDTSQCFRRARHILVAYPSLVRPHHNRRGCSCCSV
jgi:Kef-type K+ transport system membrane component KefB